MIKATKKELEKALELACHPRWKDDPPNAWKKCSYCLTMGEENCAKCWAFYYLEKAKEELKNE